MGTSSPIQTNYSSAKQNPQLCRGEVRHRPAKKSNAASHSGQQELSGLTCPGTVRKDLSSPSLPGESAKNDSSMSAYCDNNTHTHTCGFRNPNMPPPLTCTHLHSGNCTVIQFSYVSYSFFFSASYCAGYT